MEEDQGHQVIVILVVSMEVTPREVLVEAAGSEVEAAQTMEALMMEEVVTMADVSSGPMPSHRV